MLIRNFAATIALGLVLGFALGGSYVAAFLEAWPPISTRSQSGGTDAQESRAYPTQEKLTYLDKVVEPLALAAYALFLVTGWLAWYTRGLFRETAKMARDSKDASGKALAASVTSTEVMIAGQRPWLKIDVEIAGPLEDDGQGMRLRFNAKVENVGNIPATDVQVWVAMACGGRSYPDVSAGENKIPVPIERLSFSMGHSLFPKEKDELEKYGRLTPDEINDALADAFATGHIFIYVVAAANYRFAGGGVGRTRKRYSLRGPAVLQQVDVRKIPVPAERLSLYKVPLEDTAS